MKYFENCRPQIIGHLVQIAMFLAIEANIFAAL